MVSKFITISTIKDIIEFTSAASKVFGDIIIKKGVYAVDGKSIMGIVSIDPSTGVTVEYPEDAIEFGAFLDERF